MQIPLAEAVGSSFAALAPPHDVDVGDRAESARTVTSDVRWERVIGIALAAFVMLVFLVSNPNRHNFYEHFTWQAAAWLEGQAGIRYPVCPSSGVPTFEGTECKWITDDAHPYNDFFLDVLPVTDANGDATGRALIPFRHSRRSC
jgi:hypothetical protein